MRYTLDSIVALLPEKPVAPATVRTSCTHTKATGEPFQGESVIAAYNRTHPITELMLAHGYTQSYGDKWNRPDSKSRGVSVHPDTNTMYAYSQNDPMYTDGIHSASAFDIYMKLEHGNDLRSAVREAAREMGMTAEKKTPSPTFTHFLAALRKWIVTADLSVIIPAQHHGANGYRTGDTDRRAFDALLDIFERYGSFTGPISYNQGHLHSGLSADAFRNSIKRWLDTCVLSRGLPDTDGGAYHYTLDTCVLSRVGIVIEAKLPPTKYASVFSQEKGEDAWQLRGSKAQREKAIIKALGPSALHVVSNLIVGERTHQAALAGRTYKKASAISRVVKRLEDCGVVTTEKVGRQQFVTLLPDWQARVQEYVPYMPTFGNKDRREFNAETRVVENCDRQLAKGIGNTEKLLSKREAAMCSLAVRMERDMTGIDFDTQSEKMRRLLRSDALRRNASLEGKARKHVAKPWLDANKETPRMRSIKQTTEDNETLLYAREQVKQGAYYEVA